jgi:cytochrome c oxidase cbb3-type subunit 2
MPPYGHLARRELDFGQIEAELRTNRIVGVPYTDEMIAKAEDDLRLQVNPDADDLDAFMVRYPKAQVRDFDGNPERLSELDALLAYLQMLGTLVDFDVFRAEGENLR